MQGYDANNDSWRSGSEILEAEEGGMGAMFMEAPVGAWHRQ